MLKILNRQIILLCCIAFCSLFFYTITLASVTAQGVTITNIRLTNSEGLERTLFVPGENGQVHIGYTLDSDIEKNVVIKGKIKGEKSTGGNWKERLKRQKDLKSPGEHSDIWDFVVDPDAIIGSEAVVNITVRSSARRDRDQISFSIVEEIPLITTPLPPVLEPIDNQTVNIGERLSLEIKATDPNEDPLSFSISPLPLPDNANFDVTTSIFTFSPEQDQSGTFDLTFLVSDGVLSDSETITINVPDLDPDGITALKGEVLDMDTDEPLKDVRLSIEGISTSTDDDGNFLLSGFSGSIQSLTIDGSSVSTGTYPTLTENVTVIAGAVNIMEQPIFLPNLDIASADPVDPTQTSMIDSADVIMEGENFGPIVLTVPPGTAMNSETGTPFTDSISITVVPSEKSPLPLPDDIIPSIYFTIQPFTVLFDPPAPISFPNIEEFPPGAKVDIFGLNRETGEFEKVGTGAVSENGDTVDSDGGVVSSGSWHSFAPLVVIIDEEGNKIAVIDKPWQEKQTGSSNIGIRDGSLTIENTLTGIRSLNETESLRFVYNSDTAKPKPVINFNVNNPIFGPPPVSISSRLSVAGIDQGEMFTEGANLPINTIVPFRQAFQFNAKDFPMGSYDYVMKVVCNFPVSRRVAPPIFGQLIVNNEVNSLFGAGWTLDGLRRLHIQDDDRLLLTEGDGSAAVFSKVISASGSFSEPSNFLVGTDPKSVVKGDFNGDNIPDLAIANSVSSDVSIIIGDGTGSFSSPANFGIGRDPREIVTEDFNGDDILDLAVANFSTVSGNNIGDISILIGDGTGSFSSMSSFVAGRQPVSLVTGDFNGDSHIDLAVANTDASQSGRGSVSILLGDGAGSFSSPTDFFTNIRPRSVTVGDLDEDGILDIVTINESQDASVLIGDGNGGFAASRNFTIGQFGIFPNSVKVGDFNEDDHLDIVTANSGSTNNTSGLSIAETDGVTILLGDGSGALSAPIDFDAGFSPNAIEVSDFNGDGHLDIATANSASFANTDDVSILFGNGNADFSSPVNFAAGNGANAISVGDFNNDDLLDLAISNQFSDDISILLGEVSEVKVTGNTFVSPTGEPSTLVKNDDNSFTRTTNNGNRMEFDENGLQTKVIDRFGNIIDYSYDGTGHLEAITYPTDQKFTFTYTSNHLTSVMDPAGRTTQFAIDEENNLIAVTDTGNSIVQYAYDENHLLNKLTTARGKEYAYSYDINDMIQEISLPNGEIRKFRPSQSQGLPTVDGEGSEESPIKLVTKEEIGDTFTDGEGSVTQFQTDRMGSLIQEVDVLGGKTEIIRDKNGYITKVVRPNGTTANIAYDNSGNLLTIGEESDGSVSSFNYDDNNNLIEIVTPEGRNYQIDYDSNDNPISFTDPTGASITKEYNSTGLPAKVTDALGNSNTYGYDSNGNVTSFTDAKGKATTFTLDSAGNPVQAIDAEGQQIKILYDATNLPEEITNEAGFTTSFEYDEQGNFTKIVDANDGVTGFEYDDLGLQTGSIDQMNMKTEYVHDTLQNRSSMTLPDGNVITYSYDTLARPTSINLPDGDKITLEFGSVGIPIPTRISDNDSEMQLTFSTTGNLTNFSFGNENNVSVVEPFSSLSFTYDKDGNIISFSDPSGKVTTVTYDDRPAITAFINDDINHMFTIDSANRLTEVSTSVTGGASSKVERVYSSTNQLQSLVNSVNDIVISQFNIENNDIGNRVKVTDGVGNDHLYTYDAGSQLVTATHTDQPNESYVYDALGNRTSSHLDQGAATYDAANRIIEDSVFKYSYDFNGNLTSKTDITNGEQTIYTHNLLHQLVMIEKFNGSGIQSSTTIYTYNPLGKRTSKSVDGVVTKYVWNQRSELVAEFDGNDAIVATYLYGHEPQTLLSMERDGNQFVYHRDYLGSVIQITDSDGTIVNNYQYDSFGRIVSKTEGVPNLFLWAGAQFDEESGLYYMKARYYDPESGRFLEEDPLYVIGSGLNLYSYVKNNPLNIIDPDGLFLIGGAAGAAVNVAGQQIDYLSSKKGKPEFSWWSFGIDVGIGAATCGISSAAQSAKLATKLPKVSKGLQFLANSGKGKAIVNVTGSAAGSFGKDFIINGEITADSFRDFLINVGFNVLGGGNSKDFSDKSDIVRDLQVNAIRIATSETLVNGFKDDRGRKIFSTQTQIDNLRELFGPLVKSGVANSDTTSE